ncbi:reverse transcriptase [Tanacetum coccineum]
MFMGGLKGEIRVPLRMFKPVTIKDVSCLAKMQEATVALTKAKPRYSSYSSSRFQQSNVTPRTTTYPPKPLLLALPSAPRPDMCHKCSGQLYALEVVANVAEGVNDFKTMRIKGYMGRQLVHILMDIGSTHNVLAMAAARRMGCQLRRTVPLEVSVANGNQMVSEYMCKGFEWTIQGITYKTGVMIIPLGSCDMVLGVQWHPPNQKEVVELMVKELMDSSVIRDSNNSFSSPIVMVKKKDVIEELLDELNGAKVFSKLDLRSGYHQIRMKEGDIHKTAFRTHEGHYVNHTLYAKQSKCSFAMDKVEYLGHLIYAEGVSTDPSKIQAMKNWRRPLNVKWLSKKKYFGWNAEAESAFQTLKEAMITTPVLGLPNFNREFMVETDACDVGLKKMVKSFVKECDVCQRYKLDLSAYPGLIQPLPIPTHVWSEISMKFIESLPKSHGKSVILVVDWLPLAEFWYNTNCHSSTKATPYEIVYGQPPPIHLPYVPGDSMVEAVDRSLGFKAVLPSCEDDGKLMVEPVAVLERRLGKVQNKLVMFVLVQWANQGPEDAT